MGAGGRPLNVFKIHRGSDPKEVLNWKLWMAGTQIGFVERLLHMANCFSFSLQFVRYNSPSFPDSVTVLNGRRVLGGAKYIYLQDYRSL